MPKYIRTEDNKIIDITKHVILLENLLGEVKIKTFKDKVVIKQADTIEELIDEIYFVDDEDNFPRTVDRLHKKMDKDKKLTECCLEIGDWVCWLKDYQKNNKGKIKGAIYTEKGIIYVAEMNDKGELELL